MNPKSNYRVEEAAELCGCPPEEIISAIDKGDLQAASLGTGVYQISLYSLQEYYRGRRGKELFPQLDAGDQSQRVSDYFQVVSDMGTEEEGLDQFMDGFFHSGSR
ncbi:hypothetical protein AAU61_11755 [Desulfocarbo indianensis]|nr:hypothetical protein AAU61_11755 [Desulfocarbo indianensis]